MHRQGMNANRRACAHNQLNVLNLNQKAFETYLGKTKGINSVENDRFTQPSPDWVAKRKPAWEAVLVAELQLAGLVCQVAV